MNDATKDIHPPTDVNASGIGCSDGLAVSRSLPDEVREIMCECARIQYGMLRDTGWCVTCYRERAVETTRCPECQAKYAAAQERRNRAAGHKPWKAGQRGRPPKSANPPEHAAEVLPACSVELEPAHADPTESGGRVRVATPADAAEYFRRRFSDPANQ